jgi:tetratricopeptide (TPR) repeat protein
VPACYRTGGMGLLFPLALAAAELASLAGYVFREAGGEPPRRPVTVELVVEGRVRQRRQCHQDGSFVFEKVPPGAYALRARAGDFILTEEPVSLQAGPNNFHALMLPKRWAGARTFATVSVDRLAAQADRTLQKALRRAAECAQRGDWTGAALLYEQAVARKAPADVWDALGLVYLRLDRRAEALRAFEKAIEADSGFLFPYAHLAGAYLEERRYQEVAAVAHRALAADPNWLTGHALLAEAQAGLAQWEAALQAAESASRAAAGRAPAPYLLLAKISWARGDCASARAHLERYLRLNSSARSLPETLRSLEKLSACRQQAASDR